MGEEGEVSKKEHLMEIEIAHNGGNGDTWEDVEWLIERAYELENENEALTGQRDGLLQWVLDGWNVTDGPLPVDVFGWAKERVESEGLEISEEVYFEQ